MNEGVCVRERESEGVIVCERERELSECVCLKERVIDRGTALEAKVADYSQVAVLGVRYKSGHFWGELPKGLSSSASVSS